MFAQPRLSPNCHRAVDLRCRRCELTVILGAQSVFATARVTARLGYPSRLFDYGVTAVWTLGAVQARGWHNGSPRSSGAGYGIRISKADRDRYFVPGWDDVELEFPDGQRVEVDQTGSF